MCSSQRPGESDVLYEAQSHGFVFEVSSARPKELGSTTRALDPDVGKTLRTHSCPHTYHTALAAALQYFPATHICRSAGIKLCVQ